MASHRAPSIIEAPLHPSRLDDGERLRNALERLQEDPALEFRVDAIDGGFTLGATTELQLEIAMWRLWHEFGVRVRVGRPRIAYRSQLVRSVEGEASYINSVGGAARYARVRLILWPANAGPAYVFENNIARDTIPPEFIDSVAAGVRDALDSAVVARHPLVRIRVELVDGTFQASASTTEAFRAAAALAVIDAASRAETVLLEPIMLLSVITPKEFLAGVTSDLVSRSGAVLSVEETDGRCRILATVAAAELFGYSADLGSTTQGTGTYTQRLLQYRAPVAEGDDLDRDSHVGAPLRPKSPLRSSNMMLPEPVELDVDDMDALGPRFGL
jgi:elongation factor G